MFKKITAIATLAALLVSMGGLSGCAKMTTVSIDESRFRFEKSSVTVYTQNDTTKFHPGCGRVLYRDSTIAGFTREKGNVVIPWSEVVEIRARGHSVENTIVAAAAGAAVVGLFVWIVTSMKGAPASQTGLGGEW